jgi:hypothetical protein
MLFDLSDSEWHFGLDGAIAMANAYPHNPLLLYHWGAWTLRTRSRTRLLVMPGQKHTGLRVQPDQGGGQVVSAVRA